MSYTTRIRLLRTAKGFTQEHLAEISHLSIRTIQRLESGEDTSLETLRMVADALDVPIQELFENLDDVNKEKEIDLFNQEQTIQIEKRESEKQILNIKLLSMFVPIFILAFFISEFPESVQGLLGILWVGLFFFGLRIRKYISAKWRIKMNEKYPLTANIRTKKSNADDFLWWKQPVARNVLMIFWSGIVPLIFILKYVLHAF